MTTTIKHTVSNPETGRSFEATQEQWEKYEDVIVHWVEGGDVEFFDGALWISASNPVFSGATEYRKAQRKPKAGEVWRMRSTDLHFLFSGGKFVCISQNKGDPGDLPLCSWEYIAPSIEAYFAREFLSQIDDSISSLAIGSNKALLENKARLNND